MGKRGGARKASNVAFGSNNTISLREEATGKKQGKGGSSNAKHFSKVEHLERLAVWASSEASIPSLGAFFGRRLASVGEVLGVPPNPSLFSCQRCETILQPGSNCTVRIEKNKAKARHRSKKPNTSTQNNIVYTCHFCSHRNFKRGTPKRHVKEISKRAHSKFQRSVSLVKINRSEGEENLPTVSEETSTTDPSTPIVRSGLALLDSETRKRNRSTAKKQAELANNSPSMEGEKSVGASRKRRRKSWTSLKEIVERSEPDNNRSTSNLTIPFFL
ncbi:hypothetical protein UlMin_002252 [Ulmus minor]